jgi:3-methyl-2-oxobutanoate hydroxymethyltransferase
MTEKPSLPELVERKGRGEKLVMVTAYDAPGARLAEEAGVDLILVGDSAANAVLGYEATVPVTMEEMLVLTRAVRRGARRSLVVGDMPFGSFQVSDEEAVRNGIRFLKEGGADAVKVEGAGPTLTRVGALVGAGIPVMGHLGLTPQSATMLGGLKAQSRTAHQARRLYEDALALEEAGCFSLVLEAIPAPVATQVTAALAIPTIGIGAGPDCDGQVLVYHDVVGLFASPARFVKQYADVRGETLKALEGFVSDVRSGAYPEDRHTYKMSKEELAGFLEGLPTEGQG